MEDETEPEPMKCARLMVRVMASAARRMTKKERLTGSQPHDRRIASFWFSFFFSLVKRDPQLQMLEEPKTFL
jgi:hypothetical protein